MCLDSVTEASVTSPLPPIKEESHSLHVPPSEEKEGAVSFSCLLEPDRQLDGVWDKLCPHPPLTDCQWRGSAAMQMQPLWHMCIMTSWCAMVMEYIWYASGRIDGLVLSMILCSRP